MNNEYRIPNRAERRRMAKQSGFLKKKSQAPFKVQQEMNHRAAETGAEIHRINTERMLREREALQEAEEAEKLQGLVEGGMPYEEAEKKLTEKKD